MSVAEVPFALLEVKLAAPQSRRGTVAKADVIARLRASRSRLVTVIAPAGYGKTTLLARWADADPRPFAWVALDEREDDPVVFLRYVAAAIHGVDPIAPGVFEALSGPGGSTWSKHVPRVGSALAAAGRPFVLVLDDLQTVTNPACLDALAALLEYVPGGSQIAVAGRQAPDLPLARWRAEALMDEVGVRELRLDVREAGLLLEAAGVTLGDGELANLVERTEGWAAGLYLAALAIQAGAPADEGLAGDDRFVSDYFRLELLSRMPEDESRFLVQTSVLGRLCGGLCDTVLQTTGSAERLESLERRNCFVVPLDRRGGWFRYHHLFGELLRNELQRGEPDRTAALNSRAMAWCVANDLPEAAIRYGHAAGESDTVAGLVDALALPLYFDGRMETIDEWLGWFGDDDLVRYPALAVFGAWMRVLTGRHAEAERWLTLADGATSAIPLSDGSATIEPWVANLRACMMRDGAEQAVADADVALRGFPARSGWRPTALVVRGAANALLGEIDRARDDLTAAVDAGRASGSADVVFLALAELALLAARDGAWGEARQQAAEAQALVDKTGLGDYSTSAIVHVTTARVAVHEARPREAQAALTCTHRLRPLLGEGIPWLTVQVGLELTRAHLALADPAAARTVLTETESVLDCRPDLGTLGDQARELHEQVAASSGSTGAWAMSLSGAELRLLPYLATHLTFSEIAGRLFISRNTAKTEAVAIYRKFGVSSRSDAIERAIEIGLLDDSIYPPRADFTHDG
jgi:LuxR family maltose regulon positive regulatory protein